VKEQCVAKRKSTASGRDPNESAAPEEAAGEIVARLLAQDAPAINDYPLVRTLARLAPDLDYPSGVIGTAYALDEWLDCDCHRDSPERAQADAFEHEIRSLPHLNLPPQLAAALTGRHGQ
jgi:hypothetical protein